MSNWRKGKAVSTRIQAESIQASYERYLISTPNVYYWQTPKLGNSLTLRTKPCNPLAAQCLGQLKGYLPGGNHAHRPLDLDISD